MLKKILRSFKSRGVQINKQCIEIISSRVQNEEDIESFLQAFFKSLPSQSSSIDEKMVRETINVIDHRGGFESQSIEEVFKISDAFSFPKFVYHPSKKTFIKQNDPINLFGKAMDKAEMFRQRYLINYQRILRTLSNQLELTLIESLIGMTGEKIVLGFLSQIEEGIFYLEDLKSCIKLDFTQIQEYGTGLFTENTMVLIKGLVVGNVFRVVNMALPPSESRRETLETFSGINFFGNIISYRELQFIQRFENNHKDANIYFLSDVWLDDSKVMNQLKFFFLGLEAHKLVPDIIVMMGNFTSRPYGQEWNDMNNLKHYFKTLAELIEGFQNICNNTKFIFIPGPMDVGVSVLPRQPLLNFLAKPLKDKLGSNAFFMSNPCRLRFGSKDILIFREDLANKMRRHCILPPVEDTKLEVHLIHTLCNSSHLCPLPQTSKPIFWNYDHALYLYPLPDIAFIADRYKQYNIEYEGCKFVNPGSFPMGYRFVNYEPFQEDGQVSFDEVVEM